MSYKPGDKVFIKKIILQANPFLIPFGQNGITLKERGLWWRSSLWYIKEDNGKYAWEESWFILSPTDKVLVEIKQEIGL